MSLDSMPLTLVTMIVRSLCSNLNTILMSAAEPVQHLRGGHQLPETEVWPVRKEVVGGMHCWATMSSRPLTMKACGAHTPPR